jgi:hypothetical protein
MIDICHLEVPHSDWENFLKALPRHLVEEVVGRDATLPSWFVPGARGVAIASETLLLKASAGNGSCPAGWLSKDSGNVFERHTGLHSQFVGDIGPKILVVRRCGEEDLWTIEQWGAKRPNEHSDEVLVVTFGSTPLVTRSYQSAMQLADHCREYGAPPGLCWIDACPAAYISAAALANNRRVNEALARQTRQDGDPR